MGLFKKKNSIDSFIESNVLYSNDTLWHAYHTCKLNEKYIYSYDYMEKILKEFSEILKTTDENEIGTGNIIGLIKFSDDYMRDCTEFLEAFQYVNKGAVKLKTIDTEINKYGFRKIKTKDGTKTKFGKKRINTNYLLISFSPLPIKKLYYNIDLSNEFLNVISEMIYDSCYSVYFYDLIEDRVLDNYKFKGETHPVISEPLSIVSVIDHDKPEKIRNFIPNIFDNRDLLDMLTIFIIYDNKPIELTLRQLLTDKRYEGFVKDNSKYLADYYNLNFEDEIPKLLGPLYKMNLEEDENIIGGDPEYINTIQNTDQYSPIYGYNQEFMDIDEELSEDDPEYNDIQPM